MTAAHQAKNEKLDALDLAIGRAQQELADLYRKRAGCVRWGEDDQPVYGWCVVCGRFTVNPSEGFDTCERCLDEN